MSDELSVSARNQAGDAIPAYDPFVSTEKISYAGTPVQSSALPEKTGMVRIFVTTMCHVAKGSDPTATTSSFPMAANTEAYFYAAEGEKFSFIQNATGGDAYISVCR